jgi:cytochrome P450
MATVTNDAIHYDPYDRATIVDPYPLFRRMRDEEPIYYNEPLDFYALTRYEDVERALKQQMVFSSKRGVVLDLIRAGIEIPPGTLIHDEPPVHTVHRQLLSRVFTPRAMTQIEPSVRAFCSQRLDELSDQDSFDFVDDFARFVPMRVFGMLLGIPEEDQRRVLEHVDAGFENDTGEPVEYGEAFLLDGFYDEFVDARVAEPADDLITRLISTEFDDETGERRTLTRNESLAYIAVIAGAGNHTTNRLIGWTAKLLADNPDARAEVAGDWTLIPNAVEETLRYETISTQIGQYLTEDVELHGQTMEAGHAVLLIAAAANRDDRQFENPDQFDIHRTINHHVSFGYGPHFCLGTALARLEGRVAIEELLKRSTEWEIDMENATLGVTPAVRGYSSLPIRFR